MVIFLQTVPLDEPKWQTTNGLIGKSPGVGIRPRNSEEHIDSGIVMFNTDSDNKRTAEEKLKDKVPSYQEWTARIGTFLKTYEDAAENKIRVACSTDGVTTTGVTADHGCRFDVSPFKTFCATEKKMVGNQETDVTGDTEQFGYDKGAPCVFLKLNKIFGLQNVPFTKTNNSYPEGMPEDLKTHIKNEANKKQVWVNCQGKYPADKEILKGAITYSPASKGFPNFYFPYKGQKDYLSPLVAVKFSPTTKAIGQLIHIECRAWAENIGYNRRDKIGIAVFELHIMDNSTTTLYNKV
jgi:sodium/potassium-transporting ATPase subunit beta